MRVRAERDNNGYAGEAWTRGGSRRCFGDKIRSERRPGYLALATKWEVKEGRAPFTPLSWRCAVGARQGAERDTDTRGRRQNRASFNIVASFSSVGFSVPGLTLFFTQKPLRTGPSLPALCAHPIANSCLNTSHDSLLGPTLQWNQGDSQSTGGKPPIADMSRCHRFVQEHRKTVANVCASWPRFWKRDD